ncbi:MAG: hypothetical protein HN700_17930, partial [Verrucomicrobia bacterium]|nr:hypothetical protein [Verrucomicrobiota bacterium]
WAVLVSAVPAAGQGAERDARLPLPFGIGVNIYHQDQGYDLTSLKVDVLEGDLAALENIEIDNDVTEVNLKLDWWALPFLDLFGIVGFVDGQTDVDNDIIKNLSVDYEGVVYGGGVTLVGGWESFFISLTAAIMETELDTSTSSVKAFIVSPKVGVVTRYGALWGGAMYQETDEHHEGVIDVPIFGRVEYDVEFEQKESWNGSAGYTTGVGEHWQIDLEAGFGNRIHASASATYRF